VLNSEKQKILGKLQKYCAYQERCHQEVRMKLLKLKVYGDDLEEIMADLVKDNYLNEERFARAYARGKFRIKSWGRIRIKNELKRRQISAYCMRKAMSEIDDEAYEKVSVEVAKSLMRRYKDLGDFEKKRKVIAGMQRRGYEYEVIERALM